MWHSLTIHSSLLLQAGAGKQNTFPHSLAWGQELPRTPALLVQLAAEVGGFEAHSWALIPQAAPRWGGGGSSLNGPVFCVT